ncbi:acetyl-CoA carboxylase carboxyltransferase subunit beta [Mariprofundus ferrooxydans]|nr:acetyl-CoA carboxylase carboxyltransferase subunit beta [Mariprofundus ferrooxydans]
MSWFTRLIEAPKNILKSTDSGSPEGLWVKCPSCSEALYNKDLDRNAMVCQKCDHHLRMPAGARAEVLFDPESLEEMDSELRSKDPLNFKDQKKYRDRIKAADKKTGPEDSIRNYIGDIHGRTISSSIFEFGYMGGSMGSVAGEKIVRGMEHALERQCPYLLITASGGARMQEGVLSLMQMAKTSATVNQLNDARLPFICLLTDPTMGGVSASVAWLGDVILAEPKALIGFAGPRVIQETVGETLPEGFQRSEFLLEKGLVDAIIDRREFRDHLATLLTHLSDRPYRQNA